MNNTYLCLGIQLGGFILPYNNKDKVHHHHPLMEGGEWLVMHHLDSHVYLAVQTLILGQICGTYALV